MDNPEIDEISDLDQENPVDMDMEDWMEFYSANPDFETDFDYSMNF